MAVNRRIEIILAVLIVVAGAFYARWEYIPPYAERQVELAGEKFGIDFGEPSRWFAAWSVGDGQAFAVIAADPTGDKLAGEIKEPVYRFSRAAFGWLAAAASLGQEPRIPQGMAIVGAAALIGVLWMAISLRDRLGPKAWLLVVNPALYLGFAGDTAEPLAIFLLTVCMASGAIWAAMVLGVTRPTYLVALIGRIRLVSLGVLATVGLGVYSIVRFGTEDLVPDGGRLDIPIRAYIENPSVTGWALVAFAVITMAVGLRARNWAWVASGLLVLALGTDVTAQIGNAWRAAGILPVLWAFGSGFRIEEAQAGDFGRRLLVGVGRSTDQT